MGRPPRFDWQEPYLTALAAGQSKSGAAGRAGVSRTTIQRHREEQPDFAAAEEIAYDVGEAVLVDIALARVRDAEKPGDTILKLLLGVRGLTEKQHLTIAGDKESPLVISAAVLGPDE